jgi:hypothetical protein
MLVTPDPIIDDTDPDNIITTHLSPYNVTINNTNSYYCDITTKFCDYYF